MRAIGRLLLLLNIDAAMAKFLCVLLSLKSDPTVSATKADIKVTKTKRIGMIQSSRSFAGERENATLENSRQGVNRFTLTLLSCFCVFLSRMPFRASTLHWVGRRVKLRS